MEVICLEDNAFFSLIDRVCSYINQSLVTKKKWLSTEEAMTVLNIKSKTTLQKLRDEGSIRYTHPEKKWILYDADSITEYLEKHAKDTF